MMSENNQNIEWMKVFGDFNEFLGLSEEQKARLDEAESEYKQKFKKFLAERA